MEEKKIENLVTEDTQNLNSAPQTRESNDADSAVDFGAIWGAIKKHKSLYYKVLPIVFVVACIYMLAIPNYYTVTVKLSPELSSSSSKKSSLANLASTFGVNLGTGVTSSTEALFPTLYPDLMNSVGFKTSLFPVLVHKIDSTRTMTYYDYLKNEQQVPWWNSAVGGVFKAIGSLFGKEEEVIPSKIDPFRLTKEQTDIVKNASELIVCDVDKKTMVITITVTDQDPWIAATMADSVKTRLQKFITDYRTQKARVDLEFQKKLYAEAKRDYDRAAARFSGYSDSNQRTFLQRVNTQKDKYQNEMLLQQQAYAQVAAQLKAAEAKVQEDTPAFTTLQSATVPVKKTGPARSKSVLVVLFLAFMVVTTYVLYKEKLLKSIIGMT